jgi:hypothetical protein
VISRFEISIEVAAIDLDTVERLKAAGYAVFRGHEAWRVEATAPVLGQESVRAQAHVLVRSIVADYGLTLLSEPPAYSLHNPDDADGPGAYVMLHDLRRAYDPQPLARPKRKWWQRAMELGLGERKGD